MDDESTEELTTVQCNNCSDEVEQDDAVEINDEPHCQSCADEYGSCEDCDVPVLQDDLVLVHKMDTYRWIEQERHVCDSCADRYQECDSCSERHDNLSETLSGSEVCESCRENMNYCEDCDGYYSDYDGEDHTHGSCDCDVPHDEKFVVKNGEGTLQADKIISLDLPGGTISDVGHTMIANAIRQAAQVAVEDTTVGMTRYTDEYYAARQVRGVELDKWYSLSYDFADKIGLEWQGARGNFTKRLSRLAHTDYGIKLPATLVTQIGNIGREQSLGSSVNLEVSRRLNESAGEWYHEDSCWWQSYGDGRCALKTNGGFGMRTFSNVEGSGYNRGVTGRAWAMPMMLVQTEVLPSTEYAAKPCGLSTVARPCLCQGGEFVQPEGPAHIRDKWTPTADTENVDGYVIFNGYGDLSGYHAPRILALMQGMTYKKIDFECSPMYVNAGGYLVTSQEKIDSTGDRGINITVPTH